MNREEVRAAVLRIVAAAIGCLPTRSVASPTRILVIKPDHAGDMLLLTPALHALRMQAPDACISVLAGPWAAGLLRGNRDVDYVHTLAFPGFTRRPKGRATEPYRLLLAAAWRMRVARFDVAIIARDDHWWGALLAMLAGIPQRIGFGAKGMAPLLTTVLPHDRHEHVTRQALALVTAVTGKALAEMPATQLPVSPAAHGWAKTRLASRETTPWVAIHPGSGGAAKLWPRSYWVWIAGALEACGYRVLLTGGASEEMLVGWIAERLVQPAVVTDAPDLQHLGALYQQCRLVLGVDSGPLHVAAAVGTPTLALFGPGDDQRFGPWGSGARQVCLRSELWCAPCGVLDRCPRGTAPSECMTLIRPEVVLDTARRMLNGFDGQSVPGGYGPL
ncbi:MAG: glycosyltransferase family 9 protein [Herpetosiphon sp.]